MSTKIPGNYLDELLPIRRILVDGVAQRFARDVDFDSETMAITTTTEVNPQTGLSEGRINVGVRPEAVAALGAWKNPAHYVATANISNFNAANPSAANWDGQSPAVNDRVLVGPSQTGAGARGLYRVVSLGDGVQLERTEDFNSSADAVLGSRVPILRGTLYAGSTWQLTSPSSGVIQLGVDALVFERIDRPIDGRVLEIKATGDTTGEADRTRIVSALAKNVSVVRLMGLGYIDEQIAVPSGKRLEADLVAGSAWDDSGVDPDDRTDSMVRIAGAPTGSINTTLNGSQEVGEDELVLTNASGANDVDPGDWLRISGEPNPMGASTVSVQVVELVKVHADYVSGTTVLLDQAIECAHSTGSVVVSWAPNIGAGFVGTLDAADKIIPVGLEVTDSVDVYLDVPRARGFSRACVDVRGNKVVRGPQVVNVGDSNGALFFSTTQRLDIDAVECTGELGRFRADENGDPVGVVRYGLFWYDHPINCWIDEVDLKKVGGGIRRWGGVGCGIGRASVVDFDLTEVIATAPAAEYATNLIGGAYDGGAGPINDYTAFELGGFQGPLYVGSPMVVTHADQLFVFIHDQGVSWGDIVLDNMGTGPVTGTGVRIHDSGGHIPSITGRGISRLLYFKAYTAVVIDTVNAEASPGGGGSNADVVMVIDNGGGQGSGPVIKQMAVSNYVTLAQFGADFVATPDRTLQIDRLIDNGRRFTKVRPYSCAASVGSGHRVRLSGGSPEVVAAAGPTDREVVALMAANNGWILAAEGDAWIAHTGTAAVRGDKLIGNGAHQVVVQPNPSAPATVWRADIPSTGGGVQASRDGVICVPRWLNLPPVSRADVPTPGSGVNVFFDADDELLSIRRDNGSVEQYTGTPLVADYTLPSTVHKWRADDMATTGSDVDSVNDQVGSVDQTASATNPTTSTIDGAVAWSYAAGSYLETGAISETLSSGAIAMVVEMGGTVGSNEVLFCDDAGDLMIGMFGGSLVARRKLDGTGDIVLAFSDGSPIDILFTWDPSGSELYIDGVLVGSSTTDVTIATATVYTLGAYFDHTLGATSVKVGEVQMSNAHLSAGDASDYHDYRLEWYA